MVFVHSYLRRLLHWMKDIFFYFGFRFLIILVSNLFWLNGLNAKFSINYIN